MERREYDAGDAFYRSPVEYDVEEHAELMADGCTCTWHQHGQAWLRVPLYDANCPVADHHWTLA